MADSNIGSLPVAEELNDDSLLVAEQNGEAVQVAGSLLKQYAVEAAAEEANRAEEAKTAAETAKDEALATAGNTVRFTKQELTEAQKAQARANIGANAQKWFERLLSKLGLTIEELYEKLPQVNLMGDLSGISADDYVNVTCDYVDEVNAVQFTDYAIIAWQGSSALKFPVKNYKIKLYSDDARTQKNKRTFKDWHSTNSYHLKANFGDCTNFMNNMMMDYLTKSYEYLDPLPRDNARYTVDGFPVRLYINDEFAGIYFWNLKQDDEVYGFTDENDLCYQAGAAPNWNNAGNNSCAFVYGALDANGLTFSDAHAEIDYYWEDRIWDKESDHPDVLYDTIQWVSESSDDEFKANLGNYFDIDYLINYFVCMYTCGMTDSKGKNFNMLYFPEKGVWYPTFWDMDKAFGAGFEGYTTDSEVLFENFACPTNRLFDKLWSNFENECIAKYKALRSTLFTVDEVKDSINAVWGNVTEYWIDQNFEAKYAGTDYETLYKTEATTFVTNWAEERFAFMDTIFEYVVYGSTSTVTYDTHTAQFMQGSIIAGDSEEWNDLRLTVSLFDFYVPAQGSFTITVDDDFILIPSNINSNSKAYNDSDEIVNGHNGMFVVTTNSDQSVTVKNNWSTSGMTFRQDAPLVLLVKAADGGTVSIRDVPSITVTGAESV